MRGDAKLLIENIIACEKAGKFKQRATLYNFISDMVRSLKNRTDERGAHSRANRWHESSKRVFGALQEMGGPKVLRFLHETLEAPHEGTVRRHARLTVKAFRGIAMDADCAGAAISAHPS